MYKSAALLALALAGISSPAFSQALPLNTGFDHSNFTVYPLPGTSPLPDNYWIKVAASHGPANVPAFVIKKHNLWQGPLSGGGFLSQYIGAAHPNGPSPSRSKSYAIYRKCFCLMKGYQNAQMSFQIRGDDVVGVWLNSGSNNILPAQSGNFGGAAINGPVAKPKFQTGLNCVYVLVVDTGSVVTGFNLAGSVSAYGLMPMAAAGTGMSFRPCMCESPAGLSEQATINAIIQVANSVPVGPSPVDFEPVDDKRRTNRAE